MRRDDRYRQLVERLLASCNWDVLMVERPKEELVRRLLTGTLSVRFSELREQMSKEDRAQLEFEKELTKGKSPIVEILTPSTHDKTIRAGYTGPGESKAAEFEVRIQKGETVEGKVKVLSTRGGYLEAPLIFGDPGARSQEE